MYLVVILCLSALLTLGIAHLGRQVTALYETVAYCYAQEQREEYAHSLLAYAIACLQREEIIQSLRVGRAYELVFQLPLRFEGVGAARMVFEREASGKAAIQVTFTFNGVREEIRHTLRCPDLAN